MNFLGKNKGKSLGLLLMIVLMTAMAQSAQAKIVFKNEFLIEDNGSNAFILDSQDDVTGNVILQFGNTLAKTITYDTTNAWFQINDDVNFSSNQMIEARIENADGNNSLPGGAVGLGVGGRGRIVQLTGTDTIAPGCTISPNCGGGTYVWDGGTWISLTGTTSSNFNKLITVGSSGSDYTTIANGAAYLQTLSGGIMLLAAETHSVTTAVNMTNIIMIGKDASRTTVSVTGSGQLDSYDTTYEYLTIQTGAITDDMAIDVQSGSNALLFNYVDVNIQDAGDSLIDSNAGTAPTTTMKFIKSNMAGGSGTILKTEALSNLNTASSIYIDSRSSDTPLQLSDWDLTLAGGGSVNTSGIISPIPADSIIVSPNMNLQGAIDSLEFVGNGGTITLLPGTHTISSTLMIEDSDINIIGYGDSSIISASGFAGGATVGAIQVGAANGTATVNGVILKDFKLQVTGTGASDIHGIRVSGGEDNTIDNVTVQKVSGQSGSGATARIGIQMIDGAAGCTGTCILTRPVIINARVFGTSAATAYFTDGIHVSSDNDTPGVFGNDQGAVNILVDGNTVDYVAETAYAFVGVDDASLFNNRASRMAAGGGGYGIYIGNANKVNMTANIFSGSSSTTSPAIGIEDFNTGVAKQTINSVFNNNIIDGFGNGGVGFDVGFQMGSASNTGIHNNIFQSNVIAGASNDTTTAIELQGDADDNHFMNNQLTGGTNAWDTGFDLQSATQERNIIASNQFDNVTSVLTDTGTGTRRAVLHHEATVNPTANDDGADGYEVGTVWINTATNNSYILTDKTVGAAVWSQLNNAGGAATKYLPLEIEGGIRVSAGTGTIAGGRSPVVRFDEANDSSMTYSVPIPSDWSSGTDITARVYWSPSDNTAGAIDFDFDFASFAIGENVATGSFTDLIPGATFQTVTASTQTDLYSFTVTLPNASLTANDVMNFRLSRTPADAGDTYGAPINIHLIRLEYTGN